MQVESQAEEIMIHGVDISDLESLICEHKIRRTRSCRKATKQAISGCRKGKNIRRTSIINIRWMGKMYNGSVMEMQIVQNTAYVVEIKLIKGVLMARAYDGIDDERC